MPPIIANTSIITQINIFTVPEGGQQPLIELLRAGGWLERNKAFGEAHPGLYDVVFTLEK